MSRPLIAAMLALTLVLPSAAAPQRARACRNGIALTVDYGARPLARGARLLAAGRNQAAFTLASRIGTFADPAFGELSFNRRVWLLKATAELRTLARTTPLDRERLARVTSELRAAQDDPIIGLPSPLPRARLAEALVLTPEGMAEAASLLAPLIERDVVPEPEAWVVVAKLRAHAGDLRGKGAALRRCVNMAGARKHICRVRERAR